jgi:Doubled CXXCH motif (Paired_CXXCH_1)
MKTQQRLGLAVSIIVILLGAVMASAQNVCESCHNVHNAKSVYGIHGNGVGNCNMCHTMHNSQNGLPVDPDSPNGNNWLLNDATPSDVCLSCHSGVMGNVFGMDPTAPPTEIGGGNFVFLLEDNLNDGHSGASNPIPGDGGGHNILAPSRGASPDITLSMSPGGGFPAAYLGCTSCHDPHGNTNFRMLHGAVPVQDNLFTFTNPAPEGYGLSIYHGRERANRHTAYNTGFSAWCGNCHQDIHQTGSKFMHAAQDALGETVANAYNLYNGSGDIDGGSIGTSYLPAVPFEDPSSHYTSTSGPTAASRLMCLTCHRAHATSSPDAGRWDFNVTHLAEDGLESGSYAIPSPYTDPGQRSLCNKCHVKDEFDS